MRSFEIPPGLETPVVVTVLLVSMVLYGLFSCEQFSAQLERSKAEVRSSELISGLESADSDLRELIAYEQSFYISPNRTLHDKLTINIEALRKSAAFLISLRSDERMVNDLSSTLTNRSASARRLLTSYDRTKKLPSIPELKEEESFEQSANSLVNQSVAEARKQHDVYLSGLQNAGMVMYFSVLLFRTAALGLLISVAYFVYRYLNDQRAMDKTLADAQRKFRAVFDQTFQFSGVLSLKGELLEFNRNIEGFPEEIARNALHKSFWEIEWWQHSTETRERLRAAIVEAAKGIFTQFEGSVTAGDELRTLNFSVKPVRDDKMRVIMLVIEAEDITEIKEAKQDSADRAARLGAIVEMAPDGILTIQNSGKIETANEAVKEIFGSEVDQLIGTNIESLMPNFFKEDRKYFDSMSPKAGETKVLRVGRETLGLRKNGEKLPLEISLSMVRVQEQNILTIIARDITERKEAQRRVKDFYSTVSHELRTPLTSIRTALGLLEGGFAGDLTASAKPVLQIAQSESDRLIRLINDLLDIRKIEEGKLVLNYTANASDELIDAAVDGMKALADESEINLIRKVQAPLSIECDRDRILQVLTNLLSNAIKFSPPKGSVELSVEQTETTTIFAVRDDGPGVSEQEAHKLFGQFEQLGSSFNRQKHGSGLGLAISKAIVEHHGGTIAIDSSVSSGCRFWFEIPILHVQLVSAAEEPVKEEGKAIEQPTTLPSTSDLDLETLKTS